MPRVDLPDVIAEVAVWTGFGEEFTHVSEAGARVDDLRHGHVNLHGRYYFTPTDAVARGELRSLRSVGP